MTDSSNDYSDLLILAALRDRERFRLLHGSVPSGSLAADAAWLLSWFPAYWKAYPEHDTLDSGALLALLKLRGSLDEDQLAIAERLCAKIDIELDDAGVNGVVVQLTERKFAGAAARILTDYQSGGDLDVVHELYALSRETADVQSASSEFTYLGDADVLSTLSRIENKVGLKLHSFMQGFEGVSAIPPGSIIMVAAGVDAGKTSLLCALHAHLAPQIANLYGDRPILWLNNEGSVKNIQPRLYSAVLGATLSELHQMARDGTLIPEYQKRIHGAGRIRAIDAHGWDNVAIERCIARHKPALVVLDMVEHFQLSGPGAKLEVVVKVERLWQLMREMAVRYDCVVLGTAQLDNEGVGVPYPAKERVRNSRIGVQATLDLQIMMGDRRDEPGLEYTRWFSCPKNKLRPEGGRPVKFEARFDVDRCAFYDGGETKTVVDDDY